MPEIDFDFVKYVAQRRGAADGLLRPGAAYAYPGDQKVLRALARVTPVTLATAATVRLWQGAARSELLGTAVRVSDKQFPEIHALVRGCAARLQISEPPVYVAPEEGAPDAHTFGTDEDAFIVISAALVDHLAEGELRFVIGHECAHIQNNHAVYVTALHYLTVSAGVFVRWIVKPAVLALQSWARRAEITCDRAGLLCCGDLDTAQRALSKRVPSNHPHLPKRAEALQLFARTHYFLKTIDALAPAGDDAPPVAPQSLEWCDAEVARILSVFGHRRQRPAAEPKDRED